MGIDAVGFADKRLRRFTAIALAFIVAGFTFLSDERYGREWYMYTQSWLDFLAGKGEAPAQYRIGVIYFANFLSGLTGGHLPLRHMLAVLDGVLLALAGTVVFYLISRSKTYAERAIAPRVAIVGLAFTLLLYYMGWLFFYHKAETVTNFACLIVAAALVAGKPRIPVGPAACALVLVSAYLGTVRADSGFALNVGILVIAILPGTQELPLGRWLQFATGIGGATAVLGVEYYIKHVMFPTNPYPVSKFQLLYNLTSFNSLVCVAIALGPWMLTVWLASRSWSRLEGWERMLVVASLVEFAMFFVVAMANEVRLFLPYAMALIPTMSVLLVENLVGHESYQSNELVAP